MHPLSRNKACRSACTGLSEGALSSAGSERLPYKQRVGGSNPSAPTKNNRDGSVAQLNRASDYGSEGRASVSTFCVPGVRCTRASSGLWSVLCSCSSLLTFLHCPSWLSLEDTHTAPGHPFLTVNCAPTGFPGCSVAKKYACNSGELGLTPGSGRSLEKGMATHSIILAWKTQRSEEPDRL